MSTPTGSNRYGREDSWSTNGRNGCHPSPDVFWRETSSVSRSALFPSRSFCLSSDYLHRCQFSLLRDFPMTGMFIVWVQMYRASDEILPNSRRLFFAKLWYNICTEASCFIFHQCTSQLFLKQYTLLSFPAISEQCMMRRKSSSRVGRFFLYRIIHKSLRDFRTRLRNNQDRHGRKEHINK